MDIIKQVLGSQLFWGFLIGFALCVLSLINHFKTKRELRRLKGHLSDKLELEADKLSQMKGEIDTLKGENENLRMKISSGRSHSDKFDLERSLEIYARAEKTLMINAPGFAGAWETAKDKAGEDIMAEERGKSPPKKIFQKLFTKSDTSDAEVIEALPDHSGADKKESEKVTENTAD